MTQGKPWKAETSPRWVIEVDQNNFIQEVLDQSMTVPVLVDFWAPWCQPCRTLGPILEKLAQENKGRFILAKINSDENPVLAKQFGVRGIPSVKLVVEGRIADEFTGAQPESVIRQFLERHIASDTDRLVSQGEMLEEQGDPAHAAAYYREVLEQEEGHARALLGMARIFLGQGEADTAREMLGRLSAKDAESQAAKSVHARLAFAAEASDLAVLQRTVLHEPGNLAARLALGRAYVARENYREGLEQFLDLVKRDRQFNEEAGRKAMIQVFDLLGPKHPLVGPFRSRLSALLFS